ncbi:MAG: AAA family ATPase [Thermoleophilia bacterium]
MERAAELEALGGLIGAATRGDGRVVLIEGPAGIGKTTLARAARDDAAARGMAVRAATGSELDTGFPFGVVVQLLGPVLAGAPPERRQRLLGGAAALARGVLEPEAAAPRGPDASHAILHGLYWFTATLAEDAPLLLLVDDVHWCDAASLRWLEFLGRRLEGLPVLVIATARPGEAGEREGLLGALAAGPAARRVRPAPLSRAATGALLAREMADAPEEPFGDAVHDGSAGNPLLVRELARAAAENGLRGRAGEAEAVTALAAGGLAEDVGRRLAALGPGAGALARAVAVLGEGAPLRDLAALSGLGQDDAVVAADRLVAARILDGATRGFVHPVVREATRAGTPPAERAALHARAARLVAARGRPAEVAVHLLQAEPAGDPWVAGVLREAAAAAAAEGAGEVAIAQLRRALDEPAPGGDRPGILLKLAELEAAAGDPAAPERLDAALAAGIDGDAAARAHAARARLLLLRDPPGAVAELETATREVRTPALASRLRSGLYTAAFYDAALDDRRAALLEQGLRDDPGSPVLAGHLAIETAYAGAPADEVTAHARRALDGDGMLRGAGLLSGGYHLLTLALRLCERPDLARRALDAGDDEHRRTGSRLGALYMDHGRAYWAWSFGSLTSAEAHARAALAAAEEVGLELARNSLQTILAEVLLARGEDAEAQEFAAAMTITEVVERTIAGTDALAARAWAQRAQGRTEEAETDLRRARALLAERGWHAPHKARATLRLAELLAGREDGRAEALALADESLAAARRAGLPGAAAIALRVRGLALRDEEGLRALAEAERDLAAGDLALDHAAALLDLGSAERRAGRRREARVTLRRALDAAARLGAGRLAATAREELAASGARLRTEALEGVAALTPGELRVAELAARGLSNREIAETLWVTRKTVEVHLGRSYSKLGIRSRRHLAEALGAGLPAAAADDDDREIPGSRLPLQGDRDGLPHRRPAARGEGDGQLQPGGARAGQGPAAGRREPDGHRAAAGGGHRGGAAGDDRAAEAGHHDGTAASGRREAHPDPAAQRRAEPRAGDARLQGLRPGAGGGARPGPAPGAGGRGTARGDVGGAPVRLGGAGREHGDVGVDRRPAGAGEVADVQHLHPRPVLEGEPAAVGRPRGAPRREVVGGRVVEEAEAQLGLGGDAAEGAVHPEVAAALVGGAVAAQREGRGLAVELAVVAVVAAVVAEPAAHLADRPRRDVVEDEVLGQRHPGVTAHEGVGVDPGAVAPAGQVPAELAPRGEPVDVGDRGAALQAVPPAPEDVVVGVVLPEVRVRDLGPVGRDLRLERAVEVVRTGVVPRRGRGRRRAVGHRRREVGGHVAQAVQAVQALAGEGDDRAVVRLRGVGVDARRGDLEVARPVGGREPDVAVLDVGDRVGRGGAGDGERGGDGREGGERRSATGHGGAPVRDGLGYHPTIPATPIEGVREPPHR